MDLGTEYLLLLTSPTAHTQNENGTLYVLFDETTCYHLELPKNQNLKCLDPAINWLEGQKDMPNCVISAQSAKPRLGKLRCSSAYKLKEEERGIEGDSLD